MADLWNSAAGSGFEVFPAPHLSPHVVVRLRSWSPELEAFLRESRAESVVVERGWETRGRDLQFLAQYADQIKALNIATSEAGDLSFVSALVDLEDLTCASSVQTIDFAKLGRLKRCLVAEQSNIGSLSSCDGLETLTLFRVGVNDLRGLRSLTRLRTLHLNECRRLSTLAGIESLPLNELLLRNLRSLRSVGVLSGLAGLESLEVSGCRALTDQDAIGDIRSLRSLEIVEGQDLHSLEFVGRLEKLERSWLGHTEIQGTRVSLSPLSRLSRLRLLGLSFVRNSVDIEALGSIQSLESLAIFRGPVLASLEFLRPLSHLRHLAISRTRILDGDLGVLLDLPALEWVLELSPRSDHYSHTTEQLNQVLASLHPNRLSREDTLRYMRRNA